MNAIKSLSVKNFTAFREAMFEFSPGINLFIGENSTGKTHILKSIYTLLSTSKELSEKLVGTEFAKKSSIDDHKLLNIFRVKQLENFVRYQTEDEIKSEVSLGFGSENKTITLLILTDKENHTPYVSIQASASVLSPLHLYGLIPAIYIPSHEILSIYPGLIFSYITREIPYDETYFDLAVSLSANLLRKPKYEKVKHLNKPLEKVVADASKISLENERFYIELPEDGKLEANLVAEGYRKLATLVYLIRNGSLGPGSVLLWDEPEANLNPKLITAVSEFLIGLSKAGIQVFLATHDYLLANELSLHAEYHETPGIKFFSLFRQQGHDGVLVETGKTLAAIANNPILDAFVAHHDKETELAYANLPQEEAVPA